MTERLRFATLVLGAAEIAASCSGNNPGTKILSNEIQTGNTQEGRKAVAVVVKGKDSDAQKQLQDNGGVNVRVGDPSVFDGTVVGKIKSGKEVRNVVIFDSGHGQWAAVACKNPAVELDPTFSQYISSSSNGENVICYFYSDDYAGEVNSFTK